MLRILVVDDNRDLLYVLAQTLSDAGHDVRTAVDGEAAMQLDGGWAPDVAIVDIYMPRCNGVKTMHWLRARHPAVRLVAISGYPGWKTDLGAPDPGTNTILLKPFTTEELFHALRPDGEAAAAPA
jgi:CheY-like chemotaxis protein